MTPRRWALPHRSSPGPRWSRGDREQRPKPRFSLVSLEVGDLLEVTAVCVGELGGTGATQPAQPWRGAVGDGARGQSIPETSVSHPLRVHTLPHP